MADKRRKIWIDRFQTDLTFRLTFFLISYQVTVWAVVFLQRHILGTFKTIFGDGTIAHWLFFFLMAGVVMVGFLFIYDAVRMAHRIVGPLYRFRKIIRAIADGEEVTLVTLRHGDYLQDMKDDMNEMLKVLELRGAVVIKSTNASKEQSQPVSTVK